MDEVLWKRVPSDFVSLTPTQKAVSKIKNETVNSCVANHTKALVYDKKPFTHDQLWEGQKLMLELNQYGESVQAVLHHTEHLCRHHLECGLSVFVQLPCTEVSPMGGLENYLSLRKLDMVTSAYTTLFGTSILRCPIVGEKFLVKKTRIRKI